MITKQYKPQSSEVSTTAQRLEAYATQGRSYRKTRQNSKVPTGNILKGSLAALIPLAAAGTLNAQCQGGFIGGNTVTIGRNATLPFDVDGDGMDDFRLEHLSYSATLQIRPLGSNVRLGGLAMPNLPTGYTVTRGKVFTPNGGRLRNQWNNGNFPVGSPGYIGIRKGDATTGIPGWIHFETIELTNNGAKFKITEMGYESDGNNAAITGNCASLAAALPVEMLYFNTAAADKSIRLEWATATELNNEGFEVQRSSDGRNFAKIGWVSGQGTTTEEQQYSFTDDAAQTNTTYYYRLKQMDFDGTTEYSKITTATLKDDKQFGVSEAFPNPTSGTTTFQLNLPTDSDVQMMVFDLSGRLVKAHTAASTAGSSMLELNTTDLPQGQYFVKLQLGNAVEYRKVVVQ